MFAPIASRAIPDYNRPIFDRQHDALVPHCQRARAAPRENKGIASIIEGFVQMELEEVVMINQIKSD